MYSFLMRVVVYMILPCLLIRGCYPSIICKSICFSFGCGVKLTRTYTCLSVMLYRNIGCRCGLQWIYISLYNFLDCFNVYHELPNSFIAIV